ncbi:MAG: hypothetical protein PHE93_02535 [Clostridia bacterium]|nr:hypothetical protein [Clostridia bacterium]
MKIKDLKSSLQKEMDALVPDVFTAVKKVPINDMLQHGSSEQQLRQKVVMRMLFATCCMFFSVLLVTASFLISNYTKTPERASLTYVYMYVAPAVGENIEPEDYNQFELNIIVNLDNTVRFISLETEDMERVLDGLVYRNKHFKDIMVDIMENAQELGLFDTGDSSIVSISALNDVAGVATQLRGEVAVSLNNYFELQNRTADVGVSEATKTQLYAWAYSKNSDAKIDMSVDELIYIIDVARYQEQ